MARAISDRESVRRLLESATMKARAVISAIKTYGPSNVFFFFQAYEIGTRTFACLAENDWSCVFRQR